MSLLRSALLVPIHWCALLYTCGCCVVVASTHRTMLLALCCLSPRRCLWFGDFAKVYVSSRLRSYWLARLWIFGLVWSITRNLPSNRRRRHTIFLYGPHTTPALTLHRRLLLYSFDATDENTQPAHTTYNAHTLNIWGSVYIYICIFCRVFVFV